MGRAHVQVLMLWHQWHVPPSRQDFLGEGAASQRRKCTCAGRWGFCSLCQTGSLD